MSVTIERAANGWIAYDGDEPHIFVTFEGVVDFLHVRLNGGRIALDELTSEAQKLRLYDDDDYFETCCGTCGANPESD